MREELLQEYLLWNAQAFKMLYNNYYKVLSNYAFQILKDNATAEDVVQGIFSFLYESRPQFASIHSMEAYLYNAIKNNCIDSSHYKIGKIQVYRVYSIKMGCFCRTYSIK